MTESPAAAPAEALVTLISFGYGHAAPPEADAVYDVGMLGDFLGEVA